MSRLLNSQCNFENGFFTCNLPEDAVLLILKVKTKTGNHTLVEDTEKWTEKFCPWKKQAKDRKHVLRKLPGVLTPKKNNNSITSDSGQCPSPTEHEYKPRYFDEPEWLSSDKENMPPIELVTPPSLRNLSLEEENSEIEYEATMWEANVARSLDPLPRSSSPYPKKISMLEDMETDTDDNMVDITDFFERPPNEKRSPRPKQTNSTQSMTQEQCPIPQTSPTYIPMKTPAASAVPAKPHRNEIQGILLDKRKVPCGWPAWLRRQPPRVAFRINDIYVVDDKEYEEPKRKTPQSPVQIKSVQKPCSPEHIP